MSGGQQHLNDSGDTSQSPSSAMALAQHFTCAICQDIMSHPYTIVDCMHKFDKECIAECWKVAPSCPLCKTPSTKASHDFMLQGVIESTRSQPVPPSSPRDNAPIFPSPAHALGPSRGFSNSIFGGDDEERDDDMDDEGADHFSFLPQMPVRPGGNLVFPCDSCLPNNHTGYQCTDPIPQPTAQQINRESQITGRAIRAPGDYELRPPLADDVPGVMSHLQCDSCTIYVPRGFPANIRCTVCRNVYCGEYTRRLSCGGISLYPKDGKSLRYKGNTPQELINDSFPVLVRHNHEEVMRLEQHLRDQNITVPSILRLIVEANERAYEDEDNQFEMQSQGAPRTNPWTDAILCTTCVDKTVRLQAGPWHWWLQERATGDVGDALRSLPDCWYGYECRTQTKAYPAPTHASRYNHICTPSTRPRP